MMIEDAELNNNYNVQQGQSSISGLSSGAFMTVQLHLAHSASFVGAGIIAGGPYRCVESFRAAAIMAEDAYIQNSLFICMNPLVPATTPKADQLAQLAVETAAKGRIDPVENLADDRIYIFTGSEDKVVFSDVVLRTKQFYELLGVQRKNIAYHDNVPAGHAIITDNPEDSPLGANQPPYINQGGFIQSYDILRHIHGHDLNKPANQLTGSMVRFHQKEFISAEDRAHASMSKFGYAYIPRSVKKKEGPARIHIVLHGCMQGYNYRPYVNGKEDVQNSPPYGNRYFTTTGYNYIADTNNFIVLYPQVEGTDNGLVQNPDGCWDWWGYTSINSNQPDYYSKNAIQIKAVYSMLERLGG